VAIGILVAPVFMATPAMASTDTIWSSNTTPGTAAYTSDTDAVMVGTHFTVSRVGQATAIKLYRGVELSGDTRVFLYDQDGNLLGSGTMTKPGSFSAGWRTVNLDSPVNLQTGRTYTAAYFADNGSYALDTHYFCAGGSVPAGGPIHPDLDTNCSESAGHNGVYRYTSSPAFPDSSYNESNYWVDVVFDSVPLTADSIWDNSATPGTASFSGDTDAVTLGTRFHTTTSGYITSVKLYRGAELSGDTHVYVWDTSGNVLGSGTLAQPGSFTAGWRTVNLDTPVSVSASTTYVAGYYADNGRYALDTHYFCAGGSVPAGGPVYPELDTNCSESAGHNGVYIYSQAYPNQSYQESNYWIDVVFQHPSG